MSENIRSLSVSVSDDVYIVIARMTLSICYISFMRLQTPRVALRQRAWPASFVDPSHQFDQLLQPVLPL